MKDSELPESRDITIAIILHGDPPNIRYVVESVLTQDYWGGEITILCLDDGTSPKARRILDSMGMWVTDLPHN